MVHPTSVVILGVKYSELYIVNLKLCTGNDCSLDTVICGCYMKCVIFKYF